MFDGFSDRGRQVIGLAQQEANGSRCGYLGAEHVLLGLVYVDSGFPGGVLRRMGLTLEGLRSKAAEVQRSRGPSPTGSPPATPGFVRAVETAREASQRMGHDYVGPEHVLLGLLGAQEGIAARLLEGSGVDIDQVRSSLLEEMSHDPTPHGIAAIRQVLVPRSDSALEYQGGRLRVLGVEIYDVETVVAWRIALLPGLDDNAPGGAKDVPAGEHGTRLIADLRLHFESVIRRMATIGRFELTDNVGTRYQTRRSGGGGGIHERDGRTTFVPAPPASAGTLTIRWHGSSMELRL